MHNIETFHKTKVVGAESVGFRFEADLFKSALIIIRWCCCHAQHWNVPPQEDGCSRNRWFHIRSGLFQTVPMVISDCCHAQHWDVSKSEYGCCRNRGFQIRSRPLQMSTDDPRFLVVADNIETFHYKKMVAAETVGFRFESDLFKSVPIIISSGYRGQNWDASL